MSQSKVQVILQADVERLRSALRACIDALDMHPGQDEYWAIVEAGEDALKKSAEAGEEAAKSIPE
jgi:hypothetical protein